MLESLEDNIKRDFALIMGALADQRDATRAIAKVTAEQGEMLGEQREMLAEQQRMLAEQQRMLAEQQKLLLKQQEASARQSEHLARCDAAIGRLDVSITQLREHVLDIHHAQKFSADIFADHEARITALEKRQPPAA